MTTKVVMQVTPDGQPALELARFTLDPDGKVIARYRDDEERESFEDGIYVCTAEGELRPADGRQFFEALDIAFSSSTLLYVEPR